MVDNVTTNRSYQLPDPTNNLSYDINRLIAALNAIDVDVQTNIAALAGKSNVGHGHVIGDVSGLQAALDSKLVGDSPSLTGTPTAPTADLADNTTKIATTAFVKGQAYAPLASPTFTGAPVAPTQTLTDSSTKLATTAFVKGQGYITGIADNDVTTAKILDGAVTFAKVATAAIATAAEYLSKAASKFLTAVAVWDAAVPVVITYGATINLNFSSFINGKITATGNVTLGQPTNLKKGQMGVIEFIHSGAGRTLSPSTTYFKVPAGFALSTTAGAIDYISYYVGDDNKVVLNVIRNPA